MSHGARSAHPVWATILPRQRRSWILDSEVVLQIFKIYAVNLDSRPMVEYHFG